MRVTFVETAVFTERIARLGLEPALRALQESLLDSPEVGKLDPGTGGLRKVRVGDLAHRRGKRGGGRVHYLWLPRRARIYLVFVYRKDEAAKLSAAQKRALYDVVQAIKATLDEKIE